MRRGLKNGLSLLGFMIMLVSMIPASVMAEETGTLISTITQQNITAESAALQANSSVSDFGFEDIEGGVRITDYYGAEGDVVIPSSIDGKKVIEIGYGAFSDCPTIMSIGIPDSVTNISDDFSGCTNLLTISVNAGNVNYSSSNGMLLNKAGTILILCPEAKIDVNIPEGVTSIEYDAFPGSNSITSINIPGSMTTIGQYAFAWFQSLANISLSDGVAIIGYGAFYGCESITTISLPTSVTSIGELAFSDCINLTNINIFEGVTSIGERAFTRCTSLTTISLPGSVTSIGASAFSGCTSLTDINISEGVTSIGDYVFYGRINLTNISVSTGNLNYSSSDGILLNKAGTVLIKWPEGKTEIIFPKSVTSIGERAFSSCTSLTNVNIPDSVTSIGAYAFSDCTSLTNISIPESVTSIGESAFSGCTSLTNVSLPASVTSIGAYVLVGCTNLIDITVSAGNLNYASSDGMLFNKDVTSLIVCPVGKIDVNLPETVTNIGNGALSGCKNLININLPDKVTSIGVSAFSGCSSLTNIVLPGNVTSIGTAAFVGCLSLTNINLSERLTSIGSGAFNWCSKLKSITIPESVTSIGWRAFSENSAFSYSVLDAIYGVSGSYAETYAKQNGIPFVGSQKPSLAVESFNTEKASGQLVNTEINLTAEAKGGTSPYQYKFYYKLGSTTTEIEEFSNANTAIFKPNIAGDYILYVDIKDAEGNSVTASFDMKINDEDPSDSGFVAFLGKDPNGTYYEYNAADLNNAYLAYQINPALSSAKMYKQFLTSQCQVIGLKDQAKGYMDYTAAATASLMAQMKGEAFDINSYLSGSNAKPLTETIGQVKTVDKDGNIS